MEDNTNDSPPVKGVVIITLPPLDNPSLGKTITAFTLSDSPPQHQQQQQEPPQQSQSSVPQQDSNTGFFHVSLQRSFLFRPRIVLGILGISIIALSFWSSLSQETLFELRDVDRDDHNSSNSSFILPLYPKRGSIWNSRTDVEFKLGRFVDFKPDIVMELVNDQEKIAKSVSAATKLDSSANFPVKGNIHSDGLYYTYMLVGNPPKPYFLDIDTGSDLMWIQCDAPCTSCAKGAHPLYKPRNVNMIPPKNPYCVEVQENLRSKYCDNCHQCDYEVEYADHSSSVGVLAKDTLQLVLANGTGTKSDVVFGCAYDQQGTLLNTLANTDGILGLSRAPISLPSQLASHGFINNVIGHCLAADTNGGYLFLGNDFVPHWRMSWVPMLNAPFPNLYQAGLMKMNYGSKELQLGSTRDGKGTVVFDSGSTCTYFTNQAYKALNSMLEEISSEVLVKDASDTTLPICWRAKFPVRSITEVRQFFKPLNLQFGSKWRIASTKLSIPAEGYLTISEKGNVCLGILDGSNIHDGSAILLGDISLRGQLFVYDNVNEKIGWIRSNCERPQKLLSLPFF
ncbi:PREDICTED: aspartyl protease APCB1 [Nicotiana attenuata]|uniref:Aspartyl protease apcb1 n=1 Tax=Nicotiana attenuata TaxID=49451 RepID=A0A1J6J6K6_NICAT|nr:PREDICTED: aspartyl protease APCB1 [Nicotiana attenuata]OIT02857.1 aspartyl protease apcb1 [Nicotiana attenuata]